MMEGVLDLKELKRLAKCAAPLVPKPRRGGNGGGGCAHFAGKYILVECPNREESRLDAVYTNGRVLFHDVRIGEVGKDAEEWMSPGKGDAFWAFLLPVSALKGVAVKSKGFVRFTVEDRGDNTGNVKFEQDSVSVDCILHGSMGVYPDWRKVIPPAMEAAEKFAVFDPAAYGAVCNFIADGYPEDDKWVGRNYNQVRCAAGQHPPYIWGGYCDTSMAIVMPKR